MTSEMQKRNNQTKVSTILSYQLKHFRATTVPFALIAVCDQVIQNVKADSLAGLAIIAASIPARACSQMLAQQIGANEAGRPS